MSKRFTSPTKSKWVTLIEFLRESRARISTDAPQQVVTEFHAGPETYFSYEDES